MKRIFALVLMLALGLSGCGNADPGVTYPDPEPQKPCVITAYTPSPEEEEALQTLPYENRRVYAFDLKEKADGIKVLVFKLVNGSWEDVAGGSWTALPEDPQNPGGTANGRLLLAFDSLFDTCEVQTEGCRVVLHPMDESEKLSGLNRETVFLKARTEAEFQELVPIALQVVSHQDRIYPPDLDIFREPEAWDSRDWDGVYLLAISFLQAGSENAAE